MNSTDTLITEDDITEWILKRHKKGFAFKDWPESVVKTFVHKIYNDDVSNIKMIISLEKDNITGILIAKVFWDENRCHISQLMSDNKETFRYLLNMLYSDFCYMCFSYERRGRSKICYRTERFKQLINN